MHMDVFGFSDCEINQKLVVALQKVKQRCLIVVQRVMIVADIIGSEHPHPCPLPDFKEMLRSAEKNTPRKVKRDENHVGLMAKQRLSVPDLDTTLSYITTTTTTTTTEKKPERKGLFNLGSKPRIKKALEKMNIIPKMNG